MSKRTRKIRRPFENAAIHVAMALLPRLPRRAVLALAALGGQAGYLFDARSRRTGLENLNVVFGSTQTDAEKKRILKSAFTTMARTLLDTFWFSHRSTQRIEKYVEIGPDMEPFLQHKAQICITAHFGNWEILGQSTAIKGFPIDSIATPLQNKTVDTYFIRARESTGQKIIPRSGALRKLIQTLRHNGKCAFLADQNTNEKDGGIWINCFGLPAPVTSAPAMLSARTQTDVLLGFGLPLPGGRYRLYVAKHFPPPPDTSKESIRTLTEQINQATEEEILHHPQYWLWMYKRWKSKQVGDTTAAYPSYTTKARTSHLQTGMV